MRIRRVVAVALVLAITVVAATQLQMQRSRVQGGPMATPTIQPTFEPPTVEATETASCVPTTEGPGPKSPFPFEVANATIARSQVTKRDAEALTIADQRLKGCQQAGANALRSSPLADIHAPENESTALAA